MSTLWAVPASAGLRPHHILAFLTDARCSVRVVEVRLFWKRLVLQPRAYCLPTLGTQR